MSTLKTALAYIRCNKYDEATNILKLHPIFEELEEEVVKLIQSKIEKEIMKDANQI